MVCEVVLSFFGNFLLLSSFSPSLHFLYFNFDFGSLEGEEKNNNTVNSGDDFLRASKKTVKGGKLTDFSL